jgi:hypothetical protein
MKEQVKEKVFVPKPWLRKPDEEKKVQGYYYVKSKFKNLAEEKINKIVNNLNNKK